MRLLNLIILFALLIFSTSISAQKILPEMDVKNISGKMILSWKNEYIQTVKTINIQRSYDSLKFFATIGSVLNPLNIENGYVDTKPPYNKMYYRLFIVFNGGDYAFTKSYLPVVDSGAIPFPITINDNNINPVNTGFIPSRFVYTTKESNVVITIPEQGVKKFSVKFFDDAENYLFEINQIPETYLIVEKVNFKHSGWFLFKLLDGEEVIEQHKFYIPKEGYRKTNPFGEKGK